MNELTIGDKIYVSSKRAADITGYAKDYIGQLCREGHAEAKMVGRSWYVLESSVREHRFGKQEEETKPQQVNVPTAPEVSLPATWEPPTYTSEPVATIPQITPAPRVAEPMLPENDREILEMSEEEPALSEMQSAWKDWFETRRELNFEAPKIAEEREEEAGSEVESETEEAVSLPIQRLEKPRIGEGGAEVPIRRASEPVVTISPPIYRESQRVNRPRRRRRSSGSNMIAVALLIVLAGISIAIATISTGYANQYLNENPVVRFLGGTSTINK